MYAVVRTNNYNYEDIEVNVFDTEEEAIKFLHDDWQEYYNIELAESMTPLNEEQCYHEDDFAKVEWINTDQTWWMLTYAYKREKLGDEC